MTQKNWVRDELILALDYYLDHRANLPSLSSPAAQQLMEELTKVAPQRVPSGDAYRTTDAVYMKLANFQALDPIYTSDGRRGLRRGGAADSQVWQLFGHDAAGLKNLANAIKLASKDITPDTLDEEWDGVVEAAEGRLLTRLHTRRERSRKLVNAKKAEVLKLRGKLSCEACSEDFADTYGTLSLSVLEVHHTQPLSSLPGERITKLSDLALVCANCHRAIHSQRPWLAVAELRSRLRLSLG